MSRLLYSELFTKRRESLPNPLSYYIKCGESAIEKRARELLFKPTSSNQRREISCSVERVDIYDPR